MNKKFSTLLASFLLAGGLFSTADAQEKFNLTDAGKTDYYYVLKVNANADPTYADYSVGAAAIVKDGEEVNESNSWKITTVKVNTQIIGFQFTNAKGQKLQFDKDGKFTTKAADVVYDTFSHGGSIFYAVDKNGQKIEDKCLIQNLTSNTFELGTGGVKLAIYSLPTYVVPADELNDQLGGGFEFTIGKTKWNKNLSGERRALEWDGSYDCEGNVFAGKVFTMNDKGELTYEEADGVTKYIVLTTNTWSSLSNSLQKENLEGYKFATMTAAEIKASSKVLATQFVFTQPNAIVTEPLEVKAVDANGNGYELMVSHVNGVYYLTTGNAADAINTDAQLVGEASFTNDIKSATATPTENTYVKFGADNFVDMAVFNDAIWSITRTDAYGETLVAGSSCGNSTGAWLALSQVNTNYPEGQWLRNGSKFVNRESGATIEISAMRYVEGAENVYVGYQYGERFTYVFTKKGEPGSTFLGYYNEMTDDQLLKEAFYIGSPIKATGDTVYVAKATNGALYLSANVAEAVEFRLKRDVYSKNNGTIGSDLIKHYTAYSSSTSPYTKSDALNFYTYSLTEASTGLSLNYDYTNDRYVLGTNTAASFVIKNKAEGLYNLLLSIMDGSDFVNANYKPVNITSDEYNSSNKYLNETFDAFKNLNKIFAGQNTAELTQADCIYETIANDLFVLQPVSAGQHVSGIYGDTIKIYRESDPSYVMYESGALLKDANNEVLEGFLGIQNFLDPQYTEKNAAMYVDSAAGLNTWRPEYMLVVDANIVPEGKYCPIHGAGADCKDEHMTETKGYVEGRYLVNLVDSAKAGRTDCKFQNYGTSRDTYYRLGFVAAKHMGDNLIIASDNSVIDLTKNAHGNARVCDFAFHYTDASRSAFVIETAYDCYYATASDVENGYASYVGQHLSSTPGYVKYHNGIPVVTKQKSEAEVFNLVGTSEAPTANEEIAAEGVTVIAGNGNVTIAGAAGKKVVIANILGQTVANTVLTSDNATIAAPAGVVVVKVEGEAAVKAIVK